ncbi:hypothetical protein [Streptomyces sp. NPDC052127]|uniref:hypothetical protein n=1 Tax=Streptomyces sp. NPDC052127 TaxID=3155679 RepID=UPI0034236F4F
MGTPPQPYPAQPTHGAPGVYGGPASHGMAGGLGAPGPYGAPYAYAPMPPMTMPGSVRAAQVVIWVMAGLTMLIVLVWGFGSSAEAAGRLFATNTMGWALFFMAFTYHRAGSGVRTTSVVLASVQIVFSLGGLANGTGGGGLPLVGAISVAVLLNQGGARNWFNRPRGNVLPYGH